MLSQLCTRYLRYRGMGVHALAAADYFYDEKNLATSENHDFVADPRFIRALAASRSSPLASKGHSNGRWSIHVSLWCASHALKLNADIVELGVHEGSEASAIISYTNFEQRQQRMFLVDTFTGGPEEQWTKAELDVGVGGNQHYYTESDTFGYVKERFKSCSNVYVIRGRVPDVLPSIPVERIGLLMLDLNASAPERTAADFFWDRLVTGGIILSDDYGHSREGWGYYQSKLAFDDFARSRGIEVLSLPTGQGIIIKP